MASRIENLMARLPARMREAFADAIRRIKDRAKLQELEDLIAHENAERIIEYLGINEGAFVGLRDAFEEAFREAGTQFRAETGEPFDVRSERARSTAEREGARMVAEVVEGTRDGIREYIAKSISERRSSATIARGLVGRIDRRTKRRSGGIVGLTQQQVEWVENAGEQLRTGKGLSDYLQRKARPRQYDRYVRKAMKEGKPIPAHIIRDIERQYHNKMLAYRGNTIARTESHTALNAGIYEEAQQNSETAGVAMRAKWQSVRGPRTRDSHAEMHGQTTPLGQPFTSPSGAQMLYPGDTSLGAGGEETINCRCTVTFEVVA